jgi:hypothetical protein
MPVQVMITPAEAEAAVAARVGIVEGRFFTYSPTETVDICATIGAAGHPGGDRLITRLADIYGKNFISGKNATPARGAEVDTARPRTPRKVKPQLVGETTEFKAVMDTLVTGASSTE